MVAEALFAGILLEAVWRLADAWCVPCDEPSDLHALCNMDIDCKEGQGRFCVTRSRSRLLTRLAHPRGL